VIPRAFSHVPEHFRFALAIASARSPIGGGKSGMKREATPGQAIQRATLAPVERQKTASLPDAAPPTS
jgi:hypothetical protein